MSDVTIEKLQLEVNSNSQNAVSGIDALSASLSKLKTSIKGGVGLSSVARQITNLNTALNGMDSGSANKIDKLATSLSKLSSLGQLKISSSIGNQLKNIGQVAENLNTSDFSGLSKLGTALAPLANIQTGGLNKTLNALKKFPEVAAALNGVNWTQFTQQMMTLSNSLAPLATQLNTVSAGMSRLPSNINRVANATSNAARANDRAAKSYVNLWAKARMAMNVMRGAVNAIASWITESNKYIEDLNLFTASLGDYADEAKKYAEQVGEVMGIDPAEWMRNQGIFNTIIKGFGVASDRAYLMSKNLTQLGYDISSFYNISYEDAFTKLQSGIAGELAPLRRLGYDLSVARLQQEAYALGIQKKVSAMTQAEKSELRYYAIMTQVTTAQGDMARTLNAPANQLRVLQAQVIQCARALGNIFIPVLNAVLPYAIALAKVLRMVADAIASFFGFKLPEVDYSSLSNGASAVGDLAGNADDASDGLGKASKAAKKLKNNLLGIDELNIISPDNDDSSGSGSGAGAGLGGGGLGIELPSYDFLGDLVSSKVEDIVRMIKDAINEIMAVLCTALLVIGAILVFSGVNVPLGLALMAVGAIGLVAVIAENWNGMSERLAKVLSICLGILGGFLLVLGAFLTFSGANVPLGIALMAAGAVALATAATINWKFLDGKLTDVLATLMGIIGGALLALGVILVVSGAFTPLGIALIALGAASMASAVALAWDSMPKQLKDVIADITAIVGGALIALGLILAFSGVATPLGIALIAAGAVSLVSAVALKWDSLTGTVKEKIMAIVALVSGALIGIGLILALTGVATPLGIGLIAAGAVGLAATASLNWNFLVEKVKGFLKELGIAVGAALLVLGIILCVTGVGLPIGIGLIVAGAASIVAGVALNWGSIKDKIKGVLQKIKDMAGTLFLIALGLILCVSGVGIPLGIALIAKGAKDLATGNAMSWNELTDKIGEGLNAIKDKFDDFKEKVGEKIDKVKEKMSDLATKAKSWGDDVKEFWTKGEDGMNGWDNVKEVSVSLVKKGWTTVSGWIGNIPAVQQAVSLAKKAWTTVKEWVGNIPTLDQAIKLIKNGWTTVKNWIGNIPTLDQAIKLIKQGWTTVKNWIGDIPTLDQAIKLIKQGWTTVKNWIGNIPTLDQAIQLIKHGWTTVKNWVGNIPVLDQAIKLIKQGWSTVAGWIGNIPAVSQAITLAKSGWSTVSSWVSNFIGGTISIGVSLFKSGWNSIKEFFGLSSGGYDTGHGFKLFANGGYVKGGRSGYWGIPAYGNGGITHGSLFVAGEAGTEMVGRIGGQTEVLNQSQIKLAMRSAVISGMAAFTPILSAINSNIVTCSNAVINSVITGAQVLYNGIENVDTYDPTSTLSNTTYEDAVMAYRKGVNDENMYSSMRDFYREFVEPTLKDIAADTKRQADKEENINVQVGNRDITRAVDIQREANGYSFT